MKKKGKAMKPRLMMILSMVIFGTMGPFAKQIPVSSGEYALYRAILATALIAVVLLVSKQKISFSQIKTEVPLLLFSGMALGINWILLFEAYKHTSVSVATLSYYFAPVIVTAVCPFIFREKLTKKGVFCFVMSTLGLVMITGVGTGGGGKDLLGILFGLGAACFYATVIVLNKFIKNVEGLLRTFLQFGAVIIVFIPYVSFTGGITLEKMPPTGWASLLIVGLVHTGITYCMYFSAIKDLPGQKAAMLSYIDPLVSVFVSVTLLGESMTLWQIFGGILILGFTLYNEISTKEKTEQ